MSTDPALPPDDTERILAHMNDAHADDLVRYADAFTSLTDVRAARMTGLDARGLDLAVETSETTQAVRLSFEAPLADADAVRSALVDLAMRAREQTER
jgi:putative heme iron utilization protein